MAVRSPIEERCAASDCKGNVMRRMLLWVLAPLALLTSPALAQAPAEWDGLVKVDSTRFDAVYLAPGVDFRPFTKVMIDPVEVAFRRNWQRDHNRSAGSLGGRISDNEARAILAAVQSGFHDVFAEAYRAAGFQVVASPGPDVLRLKTGIANLDVAAPDRRGAGRSRTYAPRAGEATLVIEARDSMSGALLGRGVDRREAGDRAFVVQRTRATNRADFERMFRTWAQMSAQALSALRSTSAPAGETPVA
jgi:hypothetical protein